MHTTNWRVHSAVGTLLAALALLSAPPSRADWTGSDLARLERGDTVVRILNTKGPGGRLQAAIDIPRPPETVWDIMLNCARAPAYVPGLKACRILETAPDKSSDVREHIVSWISLLPTLTLRFRSDYTPQRQIRIQRIGGDLAVMEGVWSLEPLDNGRATRLTYDVHLVPKTPVPSGLVRNGMARDTPKVLLAVREEALRVDPM